MNLIQLNFHSSCFSSENHEQFAALPQRNILLSLEARRVRFKPSRRQCGFSPNEVMEMGKFRRKLRFGAL